MNEAYLLSVLPELIKLAIDLFRRFNGDAGDAVREIARIRQHGAAFVDADKAARAELEKLAGNK